jgi:hypothetical protein
VANQYLTRKRTLEERRAVAMLTGEPVEDQLAALEQIDLPALRRAADKAQTAEKLEELVPEPLREA